MQSRDGRLAAMTLSGMADERRGPVGRDSGKRLERKQHGFHFVGIGVEHPEAKASKFFRGVVHAHDQLFRIVALSVVLVYKDAQVPQSAVCRQCGALPAGAFLQFTVADHAVNIAAAQLHPPHGIAAADRDSMPKRAGCDRNAGENRPGMALDCCTISAGVVQVGAADVAKIRVNRSQRRNGMAFAQDKQILLCVSRACNIECRKSAVVKRGHCGQRRECAANMKATIDRRVALQKAIHSEIAFLDAQQRCARFEMFHDDLLLYVSGAFRSRRCPAAERRGCGRARAEMQ